ncbi:hypothetical protein CSC28_1309 [Pseudomonas paraeruginosa]|nr:hypothetical protein CSC28_1309 [Pseudomonas paraeruginosa]
MVGTFRRHFPYVLVHGLLPNSAVSPVNSWLDEPNSRFFGL